MRRGCTRPGDDQIRTTTFDDFNKNFQHTFYDTVFPKIQPAWSSFKELPALEKKKPKKAAKKKSIKRAAVKRTAKKSTSKKPVLKKTIKKAAKKSVHKK